MSRAWRTEGYWDMARAEGFYWVRKYEDGRTVIATLREGEWTIGDGEYFDEDNVEGLMIVAGPLSPPTDDVIATWKERYDKALKSYKKAKGRNALQGWDYLEGYYWVRVPGNLGVWVRSQPSTRCCAGMSETKTEAPA